MDTQPPTQDVEGPPPPKHRLWYTSATFARVNPLGLISVFSLGYRGRLSTSDSVLLRDTYVHAGVGTRLSPAFGRVGVHAEVQPLAVVKAFADYELVGYFGTFDQIFSSNDLSARYSDQTIAAAGANTGATLGSVFTAGGVLQAAVGPIAVRNTFQATRYDLDLIDDHVVFYDQYWDRLLHNRSFATLNDLDVIALLGDVRLGVRYTTSGSAGSIDRSLDGGVVHHRVGPLFAMQLAEGKPGALVDQPTLFVLAQWWAQHPYRSGEEQPAALPLIAAGIAFRGDLLKTARDR